MFKDGEIFIKIMTKQGSKDLQKNIDRASPITIEKIVTEIEPKFAEILMDQYGNYFCQKLFLRLTDEQKHKLLMTLKEIHMTPEEMKEKQSKKRQKSKFLAVA
jgi:Mg/Co/Ni transporter MgtE